MAKIGQYDISVIGTKDIFAEGLKTILTTHYGNGSINITTFKDFSQATEQLAKHNPNLIFIDPTLDSIKSLEFVKACKKAHPRIALAIIISLPLLRHHDIDPILYLQLGVQGFISEDGSTHKFLEDFNSIRLGQMVIPQYITNDLLNRFCINNYDDFRLTRRQEEILHLLYEGHNNKEIAEKLYIADCTVKMHLSRIFKVLGVKNRLQAAMKAEKLLIDYWQHD